MLNDTLDQNEQGLVNAEYELQVMNCGAFNPRFLAMIKRCKDDYRRNKTAKNRRYRF